MAHPSTSKKRAKVISSALFLFGLAFLAYFESWWPGIMLVIGIPLAIRQAMLGRYYDMIISLVVFIGVFCTAQYDVSWKILLPVVFVLAAIYILGREFFSSKMSDEDEDEEDLNHEIEEDQDDASHKN
ncbi:MAG: hypothetical protein P0S95_02945 [Rhabdochlamydiaceae bacterium]|nr:hypothetical protein [Candidatus Amphrikana amoebophyrae]